VVGELPLIRDELGERVACDGDLLAGSDVVAGLKGELISGVEAVVEVPSSLLPELAADETAHDAVHRTDRGTVLVRGCLVVDAVILRELNLPAGEAAVEIPISALPELEVTHAR